MSINIFNNVWEDLQPLFRPASVAIVGASAKPGTTGMQVINNMKQLGFEGKVFPINPKYEAIGGYKCYPSLTAVKEAGETIDEIAILLGKDNVLPVLKEAADVGVRAAWSFAAGMGEMGAEGRAMQQSIIDFCNENGIRFLGPNCVGYMNPAGCVGTYSAPAPTKVKRGNVGVVAQSGYVSIAISNAARGIGFSLMVSCGNEAVINSTDVMEYMLEDPDTKVIMAFIEQFRDPDKLIKVARRAKEIGKPIVLIKVGRSRIAKRATAAHTGALAGSDAIQDAIFRKYGIIRVDDLDEMYETAVLFSGLNGRVPKGYNAFATTLSGGIISLLADVDEGIGINFPAWSEEGRKKVDELLEGFVNVNNPLDAWGSGHIDRFYEQCLLTAAEEESANMMLVIQDVPPGMSEAQVRQYSIVANAAVGALSKVDKPVIWITNAATGVHPDIQKILDEAELPVLHGTRPALKAIANAVRFYETRIPEEKEATAEAVGALKEITAGGQTEYESKKVLRECGIACANEILCGDAEACVAAAEKIGYPVVMKVMSRQILHKTEAKALKVGIADADAVRVAYGELMANAKRYKEDAGIDGMLVQEMAPKAVSEMIVGISNDPVFGPAVILGTGGVAVEVFRDSTLAVPPFDKEQAMKMIHSIRGVKLMEGFRGNPKADMDALAETLVAVGDLAAAGKGTINALDINPLLVYEEGKGVLAVDALLDIKGEC